MIVVINNHDTMIGTKVKTQMFSTYKPINQQWMPIVFEFVFTGINNHIRNAAFLMVLSIFAIGLVSVGVPNHAEANSKYAGIVIDVKTGKTLYADNADSKRYPASLTKIMTLYLVFEELEAGRLSLNTKMKVSKRAAGQAPSKLGLKVGSRIRVKDAIRALVTKSANDVAVVIAEHIGGTEVKFAKRMTKKARKLGMKRTQFRNANGLPNKGQLTSARDMAKLGISIQRRFPSYYKYFSTRSFTYKGRKYRNHNRLLGKVQGVDGIKTGYTRASGFNLVTSVKHSNRHIVAVVMGGRTGKSRDAHMKDLIKRYLKKAKVTRTAKGKAMATNIDGTVPLPRARSFALAAAGATVVPAIKPDRVITAGIARTASAPALEVGSADDYENTGLPEGWQIQIGAVPSEDAANILLNNAQNVGGRVLNNKVPFTEPVLSKGYTLHRARFAGFTSKNSARKACNYLKSKEFACLATQ